MREELNISKEKREAMSQNGKLSNLRRHKEGFYSSESQSKRRLLQIKAEQEMAADLEKEGYIVFSPTVVCDRIAVKDGKVYFVEFKKTGQLLRAGQQVIHDLIKDNYIIRYK